jgi:nitrite reductase/ring-hydroxylating ferredoxin subunit
VDYVKIAPVSDFERVRFRSYAILARRVGVFRDDDGTFVAREVRCKHQGADLGAGRLVGSRVTCPRHGWEYDLRTGECTNMSSLPLRAHGLKIENGWIHVTPNVLEAEPPPEDDWGALFKLKNP